MTNEVQKIREGIEKLKSQLIRGACASQLAIETRCKEEAYNEVLAMLDLLQEEPVSEKKCLFTKDNYTDEDRKVLCEDCDEDCEYAKKEKPSIPEIVDEHYWEMLGEEPVSIWHDASEKPKRDDLLIETNDGRIIHRQSVNNYGMVKRWAYTSDLLNLDNSCNFGNNLQEEPVSEDLGEYINELSKQFPEVSFAKLSRIAVRVVKWKEKQMMAKAIDARCFGFQGSALFSFRLPANNYLVGSEVKVIVIKED